MPSYPLDHQNRPGDEMSEQRPRPFHLWQQAAEQHPSSWSLRMAAYLDLLVEHGYVDLSEVSS